MKSKHAIVVGGGMAGITAAAFLAKEGKSVILFEKNKQLGGLVNSYVRNGFTFDGGIRSIENSGIVFPMLEQLGIEVDFIKSNVSIGIEKDIIKLKDKDSLANYRDFLVRHFPHQENEIDNIMSEIRKIMGYMDMLYGIDNPVFKDLKKDPEFLRKVMLPWLLKYVFTIGKILKLNDPVDEYILKFTKDQALIDIIVQHFFQKTPTFFALSYFSLYLDYHYPRGGTGALAKKMENYLRENQVDIKTQTLVSSVNPETMQIIDVNGNRYDYSAMVWAADLRSLYNMIPVKTLSNGKIKKTVLNKQKELRDLHGGDSVFTLNLAMNKPKKYFADLCSEHFFYTPLKDGLTKSRSEEFEVFMNDPDSYTVEQSKSIIKNYLEKFFLFNTYEISFPALRDKTLAPEGKTGAVISTLFDYNLTEIIEKSGWYDEFKVFAENCMIKTLEESIFPGLSSYIEERFSSTPISIEKFSLSTDGAITGWAFTNSHIPVTHKMTKMFSSYKMPLPNIYKAGQWSYSPSGLPIAVLTGKLAADKILKKL